MDLNYCLAYLIAYMVEPVLWMSGFHKVFQPKYAKKNYYIIFFAFIYSSIVVKQYINFTGIIGTINYAYMPLLFFMLFFTLCMLYETNNLQRFGAISTILISSTVADATATFGCGGFFDFTADKITSFGRENLLCTILSKIILILFYVLFFPLSREKRKKEMSGKEILCLIIPNLIINYLVLVYGQYNSSVNGKNMIACVAVIFDILFAIYIIIYILDGVTRKREKLQYEMDVRLQRMEQELAMYSQIEETAEELRRLRHDMKAHFEIINELCSNHKYREIQNYIAGLYKDIEKANDIYLVGNVKVSILLGIRKQRAKKEHITLSSTIMVKDFVIEDEEICSLLANVLDNAIEAVKIQDESQERYIRLTIDYKEDGYFIFCENSFSGEIKTERGSIVTRKADKKNHGLGIRIIKEIADKNGGYVQLRNRDNCFSVFIFLKTKCD